MNEEKDITTNENVEPVNIDNDKKSIETVDTIKEVSAENDVSKVKVRTILKQRFRKLKPSVRMAIPIILVGIICLIKAMDKTFIKKGLKREILVLFLIAYFFTI